MARTSKLDDEPWGEELGSVVEMDGVSAVDPPIYTEHRDFVRSM